MIGIAPLREVSTEHQVQDLHTLLTGTGIPGPYLLVGLGTGGFNIALYAFHSPEEVADMVCVGCNPPTSEENLLKAFGEAEADKPMKREVTASCPIFQAEAFSKLSNRGRVEVLADKDVPNLMRSEALTKAIQEIVDRSR